VIKGGLTSGQQAPNGIHISTGVYGKAIKLVYGLCLVSPDLIWYNDWVVSSHSSNPDLLNVTGGGAKKSGKKGSTSYYSAAIDMVLGHAPIIGVLAAYYNNQKFACPIVSATGVIAAESFEIPVASGGIVAAVVAVTVSEAFTATFNDFGGNGTETINSTWNRPLWNSAFAVPGNINPTVAFNARDPYTFTWNGATGITVPAALNGLPVTVWYATPQIVKANGRFYSSTVTPLALLNMEMEFACGSGSEYVNHPAQQITNSFCSGVASVQFDLGAANAVPNLNLECMGAFTLWPNGDCDVADIITDICTSGPVLLGAN
jgi:hypothetical protein